MSARRGKASRLVASRRPAARQVNDEIAASAHTHTQTHIRSNAIPLQSTNPVHRSLLIVRIKHRSAYPKKDTNPRSRLCSIQPGESSLGRLQPIPAIVDTAFASFDDMKGVDHPPLVRNILLALVQQVAMYQDQSPLLDLTQLVHLLLDLGVFLETLRPLPSLVVSKPRAGVLLRSHKSISDGRALVAPRCKGQAAIFDRAVLECIPEPHGRRWVRVQERTVLMGRDPAADFGLFADDHGLQDARVSESK